MRVYALACLLLAGFVGCEKKRNYHGEIDAEKRDNLLATLRGALQLSTAQSDFPDHDSFYRYEEVNRFLHNFANYYPELVVLKTMNQKTPGGKTVYYLEIGSPVGSRTKPVIFIEGLTDAREWAAGAVILYTIDMLLRGYKLGSLPIVDALNKYTWVLVPIVNPDGYAFTWESKRVGQLMANQLPGYFFGTAYRVHGYGASGASEDWALHDKPGIYSFTYKTVPIRWDVDLYPSFPDQIRPTGKEFMRSVLAMAQNMKLT